MHQNVVTLGGVCVSFLKSVRKGRFRNVWVGGGVGGHSFAHRAVNGRTHRAQAMPQGSLIIPNPFIVIVAPFHKGQDSIGAHIPLLVTGNILFSMFPNPEIHVAKPWWDESFYPKTGLQKPRPQ